MSAFIVDSNGRMIAASSGWANKLPGPKEQILANLWTSDPIIVAIALEIETNLGGWNTVGALVYTIRIRTQGLFWFQVTALRDDFQLDWYDLGCFQSLLHKVKFKLIPIRRAVVLQPVFCDPGFVRSITSNSKPT
jgi:hypothetical protein